MILLLLLTLLLSPNTRAQSTDQVSHSTRPVPFAVRSPYLNIWNHIWTSENQSVLFTQTTFNATIVCRSRISS